MSVPDIAFCILKNRGKVLHFKELIAEVMAVKAINQANPGRLIAQWHTEINLDSRFIHQGNGEWGLREWQPKQAKVVKIRPDSGSAPSRSRGARDEEDEDTLDFVDEEDEVETEEEEDGYSRGRNDQYEEDDDER